MIKSFRHKALKEFFETGRPRKINAAVRQKCLRRLDDLDAATEPEDLNKPGYRFHQLSGNRAGTYSISVTGNWRITFEWDEGATRVDLEDYH